MTNRRSTAPASRSSSRHRHRRGSAMLVAMIALTGLVTLGSLTVMSIQGGITAVSHDRSKSVALYIAESGAAAGADYLRKNIVAGSYYSSLVEPNNVNPQQPTGIVGNGARPGQPGNMFSADMNAWYEVEILNNVEDRDFAIGNDSDKIVIVRATGHGPNGSTAQVEWYVEADAVTGLGRPCPSYGQKGMAEDGAGRNDCLTTVIATGVATYSPGGP